MTSVHVFSQRSPTDQLSSAVLSATRKLESEVRMQAPRSPAASERTTESEQVDDAIDSAVEACHSDYWSDKAAHQHSAPSGSRSRKESILPSHDAPKNMNPEWSVESSFLATFAQPQFHLQSDADDGADAVATAEVAVLRTFAVSDPSSEDATHSTILHRNYGELRTLQVFYPQPDRVKALYREQATSFVPLEVIFDGSLRYECDCMVGSTHLSIRFDKFNRLRMNNIGHARFHHEAPEAFHQGRDEITLSMGQFEVAATRTQFAGLLHIFQKLALYTNPDRKRKNERVETARLTADYSDPKFMVRWIEDKQKAIRKLHDRLNDASQVNNTYQYYCIHAEALSESERLNTYLQVMSEAQDQYDVENKRRKGDLSIRARSSQIVLSMLDQEHRPFVKAAIKDIGFKWRSHEDGSLTNQLVIGSITADNYLPDAQFLEILYPLNDATLEKDFPLKGKNVVMAAMWSVLPPVGGVSIVDDLQLFLHPINLLLEQRTATMCWDYFFDAKSQVTKSTAREKQQRSSNRPQPYLQSSLKSPDHLSVPSPPPSSSSLNSSAMNSGPSIRSSRSSEGIQNQRSPHWEEEIGSGLSQKDVQIMRDRARTFRTFLRVDMPDTLVYLTYRVGAIYIRSVHC